LDVEPELDNSDIVIRDKNGDYEVGDPPIPSPDEQDEHDGHDTHEDEESEWFKVSVEDWF
jgi:hypothetical protein